MSFTAVHNRIQPRIDSLPFKMIPPETILNLPNEGELPAMIEAYESTVSLDGLTAVSHVVKTFPVNRRESGECLEPVRSLYWRWSPSYYLRSDIRSDEFGRSNPAATVATLRVNFGDSLFTHLDESGSPLAADLSFNEESLLWRKLADAKRAEEFAAWRTLLANHYPNHYKGHEDDKRLEEYVRRHCHLPFGANATSSAQVQVSHRVKGALGIAGAEINFGIGDLRLTSEQFERLFDKLVLQNP